MLFWICIGLIIILIITVIWIAIRYMLWKPDPLSSFFGSEQLLLGHRGAVSKAPENTITSFMAALTAGAHGVELDVRFSKDKKVMVIHDSSLERTTDCRGMVGDYTCAELKSLDAGSWLAREFSEARIPTLEEVLERLPANSRINIEIKNENLKTDGLEKAVAKLIARFDLYHRVIVSSFNPLTLFRVKVADSRIPIGFLREPSLPAFLRKDWVFLPLLRPEALHPYYSMVDQDYLEKARHKGYGVIVWSVNDKEDFQRMLELGVDGIITDRPAEMVSLLRKE